ncbi:MAG: Ldh family oxidoreductase [Bacteroidales bacterium]|nr:Ldh family oxidoreductase [Bacteroidales bacterium]
MYTYDYLLEFTHTVFIKMGCSKEDALNTSKVFLAAELRGLSSHGMLRIKDYYQLWKSNRINTDPNIRIVHETPSTAVVDGDGAIGMVAATKSMEIAIEKSEKCGSGWVSTRGSNHFGIAGYYAMMALEREMIGITMTNANPLVAPTYSISRLLGTNPIAVAIPSDKQPPFVADFSTTPIARGKLAVAEKKGEKTLFGYVQDKEGKRSNEPSILKEGGSMLTLGGDYEHGSHKGYCLSAIVDIFSAVLSGANFGPYVPPSVAYLPVLDKKVGEGTGHFFGAMRIDAFQPAETFKAKMDQWIETFREAKSAPGMPAVKIPGDLERENEEIIRNKGIQIIPAVAEELKEIASELGMEFEVRE